MKKYFLFLSLTIVWSTCAAAQLTKIDIADNFTLDRVYLGLNTWTGIKIDELSNSNFVSLQTGIMISHKLRPTLRLRSFGAIRFENNAEISGFSAYEIIFTPHKKLAIHLGAMTTPTTELRPNPTTWQSQAETNAQSKIIGGRTGIKLRYNLDSKSAISYGVFNHSGVLAHHVKFKYDKVSIAGYIESNFFFAAAEYQSKKINTTITYLYNKELSASLFYNFSNQYSFLLDSEYNFLSKKMIKTNIGLRKYYASKKLPIRGFFVLSYDPVFDNIFQGGFMIHI
jgi:hypothetical protein